MVYGSDFQSGRYHHSMGGAIWTSRGALASKQSDGVVEIVKGAFEPLQ